MPIRFLLSHNYKISETHAPPLSKAVFSQIFETGLMDLDCQVQALSHPHWLCEVITEGTPLLLSERLAQALVDFRTKQLREIPSYKILALGGLKNSPATSSNPEALQPGEWGVDIVETVDEKAFLALVGWDALVSNRASEDIFKVVVSAGER